MNTCVKKLVEAAALLLTKSFEAAGFYVAAVFAAAVAPECLDGFSQGGDRWFAVFYLPNAKRSYLEFASHRSPA